MGLPEIEVALNGFLREHPMNQWMRTGGTPLELETRQRQNWPGIIVRTATSAMSPSSTDPLVMLCIYSPVIKHSNGRYTICRYFSYWNLPSIVDFQCYPLVSSNMAGKSPNWMEGPFSSIFHVLDNTGGYHLSWHKRVTPRRAPQPFLTTTTYPLVICYSLLLKTLIEIVDLPINSMGISQFANC